MWKELGLKESVVQALAKCGFEKPTEIQQKSIKSILQGKDLVGGSATGSGKTLAFGLPTINNVDVDKKGIEALIVCPTRELAIQVCDELKRVAQYVDKAIKVVPIYGGADFQRQVGQLVKGAKIVVGTPGRILDHLERKSLKLKNSNLLILDEADEMLSMGFRPDIEKILARFKEKPQILLFSATMPKDIMALIDKYLQEPKYVMVQTSNKPNQNITQYYIQTKKDDKMDYLLALAYKVGADNALLFCNTKAMTERVSKTLRERGFKSDMLNGDMSQQVRKKVLDTFKKGDLQFLVCTDVASRGIDIDSLPYVINYDLPKMTEWYIHRIGRTGRKGNKGKAVTLINKKEQLDALLKLSKEGEFTLNKMEIDVTQIKDKKVATKPLKSKQQVKEKVQSKGEKPKTNPKSKQQKVENNSGKVNKINSSIADKIYKKEKQKTDPKLASGSAVSNHKKGENAYTSGKGKADKITAKNAEKAVKTKNSKQQKSYYNANDDFGYEGFTEKDLFEIFADDLKPVKKRNKASKKSKNKK